MLNAVVRDKASEAAQETANLFRQLQAMERAGLKQVMLLPSRGAERRSALVEWAAEIRLVANAAAHLDELVPVDQQEAAELARLCRQLLMFVYETPASIRRARATT